MDGCLLDFGGNCQVKATLMAVCLLLHDRQQSIQPWGVSQRWGDEASV